MLLQKWYIDTIMFRFFSFVFGICAGFIAAVFVLPIPSKTFFNKMSKLPKEAKDLVDDTLDLNEACTNLAFSVAEALSYRMRRASKAIQDKAVALKDQTQKEKMAEVKELELMD